jgi:hypothetical protein
MSPRLRGLGWRRLLAVSVLVFLAIVGGAYGVLVLVTPDAPPPPRFGENAAPKFSPGLDGRWYAPGCRRLRVLGGWVQPGGTLPAGRDGRDLAIEEPIDLTGLRMDGRPQGFEVGPARLSIRWQRSVLTIEGDAAGAAVAVRLRRQPQDC